MDLTNKLTKQSRLSKSLLAGTVNCTYESHQTNNKLKSIHNDKTKHHITSIQYIRILKINNNQIYQNEA